MADTTNSIEVTGANEQLFYFQNYLIARRRGEPVRAELVKPGTAIFSWTGDPTAAEAAPWAVMCGLQVVNPAPGSQAPATAGANDTPLTIEVSGTNYQQYYYFTLLTSLNYSYYSHIGKNPPYEPPVRQKPVNSTTVMYSWPAYPSVAQAAQYAVNAGLTVVNPPPAG